MLPLWKVTGNGRAAADEQKGDKQKNKWKNIKPQAKLQNKQAAHSEHFHLFVDLYTRFQGQVRRAVRQQLDVVDVLPDNILKIFHNIYHVDLFCTCPSMY